MIIHLTARARRLPLLLTDHEVASWLWSRLRETFPDSLSSVLMPTHPHLVTETDDIDASRRALANLLAGLRRSDNPGAAIEWEPVAEPDVLADPPKAGRMVRYVTLNPNRAGLVDDPLAWPWSTHRDLMGAVADPWVDASRLAQALARPERGFAEAFHRYVSSDPSVAVAGTPPPQRVPAAALADQPLSALIAAAAAANRGRPLDIERRGPTRATFLQLAATQGWDDTSLLAFLCGISPRAVQKQRRRQDPRALAAAQLCLGDARLRRWRVDAPAPNPSVARHGSREPAPMLPRDDLHL